MEECSSNAQLAELLQEKFTVVCDMKQSGDNLYYRLNDEKVQCNPRLYAALPLVDQLQNPQSCRTWSFQRPFHLSEAHPIEARRRLLSSAFATR